MPCPDLRGSRLHFLPGHPYTPRSVGACIGKGAARIWQRGEFDLGIQFALGKTTRAQGHHILCIDLPPHAPDTTCAVIRDGGLMNDARLGNRCDGGETTALSFRQVQGVSLAIVFDVGCPHRCVGTDAQVGKVAMQCGIRRSQMLAQWREELWLASGERFGLSLCLGFGSGCLSRQCGAGCQQKANKESEHRVRTRRW